MSRHFNIAGPCEPADHYMIPPESRLPEVRQLLEEKAYFVVHAPRQVGKTTLFRSLARVLTAEGRYAVLHTSLETAEAAGSEVERGITTVIEALQLAAARHLPEPCRPPAADRTLSAENRLLDLLSRWAEGCPRPLVLFLDEIDSLLNGVLISTLRQLRSGYPDRPRHFPYALALIGLRDVRDYRLEVRPEEKTLGTASPFNIKVRSLLLPNFTADEVAALYRQHTEETGQAFTPEAVRLAFELTEGQPWLVNALADQAVRHEAPDPATAIERRHVERAKEALILRRDSHLDSLIDRLRLPRVRRVLAPLLAGEIVAADVLDDDVQFIKDLGLVVSDPQGLTIANPIYREVIPRALTAVLEESVILAHPSYVGADGRLLWRRILDDFRAFYRRHGEALLASAPYSEAAAQLVFMAFLHKVVNGGGTIEREYAVGSGRTDLCVRWPSPAGLELFAVELKVWRDHRADPQPEGLEQLGRYLDRLGLAAGTLILFDHRAGAPARQERIDELEHRGKRILLLRL